MRRLAAGLVVIAAACGGSTANDTAGSLATTSTFTTTTVAVQETAASVSLGGNPLPRFGEAPDPAVGLVAPVASGAGFDGTAVEIAPSGNFTVVMFLAHWCTACQGEVEEFGPYFAASPPPDNVDVISVSTGVAPNRPNYPPSEWLTAETWPLPVLVDTAESDVAAAYGLNAYPFWVVLGPDGVVLARTAGSLPLESVEALFGNLAELEG